MVWTTIEEEEGRFRIEYLNLADGMNRSHDKNGSKEQIETTKPSYMPNVEQFHGFDKGNLENERMYAKADILFNKRIVRLMDISLEEWLELKYGDAESAPINEVKHIVTSWLSRSFKMQFYEFMEIKNVLWVILRS